MNKLLALLLLFIHFVSFSQTPDRLFYSSMHPEGWDIYLSRDGGESFENFTNTDVLEYNAVFSPDGKWLVYTSEKDGTPRLCARRSDGTGTENLLIDGHEFTDQAAFSPDGEWLVFASSLGGDTDIFRIPFRPDSIQYISAAINLTNHDKGDFRPAVSPDGKTIAFSSDRDHPIKSHERFPFAMQRTGDIYLMDWDGGNVRRITESDAWDGSPAWSADGQTIWFYSERSGESKIYRMDANGENKSLVGESDLKMISPVEADAESLFVTAWVQDEGYFDLYRLNTGSGEMERVFKENIDMHTPAVHSSMIAFHGGKKPGRLDENKGGFTGDLLVAGHPYSDTLDGQSVALYGVRRAFAAPPSPTETSLIIDSTEMASPLDDLKLSAFIFAGLLIITLLLALSGIVLAFVFYKKVRFWRFLLYTFGGLLIFILAATGFGYMLFFAGTPVSGMRLGGAILAALFLVATMLAYRVWKRRKIDNRPHYRVTRMMTFQLGITALACVFFVLFFGFFFDVGSYFFKVDYRTGEIEELFRVELEDWVSPANSQVIDMKYLPDNSGFLFTMGSFRTDPDRQGDLYVFRFEDESVERLTGEEFNDGFGSYSADMQKLVYRSGKSGNMDLYLRTGDEEIQLTDNASKENFPVMSPDGTKVVYCSDERGTDIDNGRVRTMDMYMISLQPDGTWGEPEQLTNNPTQEAHPGFSPDGEWITYTTEEFGIQDEQPLVQHLIFAPQMYGEIVAQRLSDGKKVRITHTKWEDGAPLWEKGINQAPLEVARE